jgi:MFS transporter, YNFM family, putative membrane transport protein
MESAVINTENTSRKRKKIKANRQSLRFKRIQNAIFLSGLSIFTQLYLFQPMLPHLCKDFNIGPATSSWAVSAATLGMAVGLFFFSFKADSLPRKQLMGYSMLVSSLLTILSAFIPYFWILVGICFVKGALLSGVSAVALAYLTEEVDEKILGLSISLYLSGNAVGGMSGRIVSAFLSGWLGWQLAVFIIGILTLIIGLVFFKTLPVSKHFVPKTLDVKIKLQQMGGFLMHPLILRMYLIATLLMGCFVSIYNYTGFHLEQPPYALPQIVIAGIFIMYTVGIIGSLAAGKLSDHIKPTRLLNYFMLGVGAGLIIMLIPNLLFIILGLGVFTFSFFGTHALASRIVSLTAIEGKSSATSLYWLFYYTGSAVIGSSSGIVLTGWGWSTFLATLLSILIATLILMWSSKFSKCDLHRS